MEPHPMCVDGEEETSCVVTFPFARSYQIEAYKKALEQNTIVFLETGSGKTLIAIMLLRSYANMIRKPSNAIAVFLVPQVVLVHQQSEVVKMHTDLKVGVYWGDMNVDLWDAARWHQEYKEYEVLVMTPAILLSTLRHGFLKLQMIKLMIIDECHHAKGKHPYACIMIEFYHKLLSSGSSDLPRILGMTASPVNSKVLSSREDYLKRIINLENTMHSKVYTVVNESILAEFIPVPKAKLKKYDPIGIPCHVLESLKVDLNDLVEKHKCSLGELGTEKTSLESLKRKILKIKFNFIFCLEELGLWLAFKAAEKISAYQPDIISWANLSAFSKTTIRKFSKDAMDIFSEYIPSDCSIGDDLRANVEAGFLTRKVMSLIDSLVEYRGSKDMRCIIFVERIITAIVLCDLLRHIFVARNGWKIEYIAGFSSLLPTQPRKRHNKIVDEFRRGKVHIIISTSILEEGLDVQSCNLVVRFDMSTNVCSFIQSKGRARMQNSVFLLMLRSDDVSARCQVEKFLSSGNIMKEESVMNLSTPCLPFESEILHEKSYRVERTGAVVTLSSSISLLHFYCSRLPSDGFFRPYPSFCIDKESQSCTLYLPKNCPLQFVQIQGDLKFLKQMVCLEACKQLHMVGALTDNLIPDIVVEKTSALESENVPYNDDNVTYFPSKLIGYSSNDSMTFYHCYLIQLKLLFDYEVSTNNIMFLFKKKLGPHIANMCFNIGSGRGSVSVRTSYIGGIHLSPAHINMSQKFQVTLLRILLRHSLDEMDIGVENSNSKNIEMIDYLVLPSTGSHSSQIDWGIVRSVLFMKENTGNSINCDPSSCSRQSVHTRDGYIHCCALRNSIVCTPHNGDFYINDGFLDRMNATSFLPSKDGSKISYKKYFESRGVELRYVDEPLVKARRMFQVPCFLNGQRKRKEKNASYSSVELPPEICSIMMSPISISTVYSYSFVPAIMHRIQSMLIADDLKTAHSDYCLQNGLQIVHVPTDKVLEAITTKKCEEGFDLESLETLGDSFLKYISSQWLFVTYQSHHEGLLTIKKSKIVSNSTLCRIGCEHKLPGFIRLEPFDPKNWLVPGERLGNSSKIEVVSVSVRMYVTGTRKVRRKIIADVVEALIGAYLSSGDEKAALSVLDWLGFKLDFVCTPYARHFPVCAESFLNLHHLQATLNYSFRDPTLLVEALTHGSYMIPEIPRSYQRLEFLGDAVLDYVVTHHLYIKYPGLSPGMLTDLRSASVNNDCYAHASVKAKLHQHILHFSNDLFKQIMESAQEFERQSAETIFGWNSEIAFPKVLGDVIESLAGAIFVDCGYRKDVVFECMRPLLEPLIAPETLKLHPVRELFELCQKWRYDMMKSTSIEDGFPSVTVEVITESAVHRHTSHVGDKKLALKLASKEVLRSLKQATSQATPP